MAPTEEVASAVSAYAITQTSNWWEEVNRSIVWQDRIFHVLAALYGIVAAVALVLLRWRKIYVCFNLLSNQC